MANYGIHFMAGSRRMTPKQFSNLIAGTIGSFSSNIELQVQMERDKAAIRSLLQIAAIVFQRIVSRTPMDEEYEFINLRKMKEAIQSASGEENFDVNDIKDIHRPDDNVLRYDWTMMVNGENVKIFTCREFIAKDPNFGMEFNNKKDINLVLTELLSSNMKPKYITDSKGQRVPDFQISFDNPNPHFRTLEFGKYKKTKTELKQGEHYQHGIDENHYSYQAPKGFYTITMREYEAFIASHEADRWRTLSQKMLRQKVEKVLSEKKFNQIFEIIDAPSPEQALVKSAEDNVKKNEEKTNKQILEELKVERVIITDEMIEQWIFYESDAASYYQEEYGTNDFETFKKKFAKADKLEKKDFRDMYDEARKALLKK